MQQRSPGRVKLIRGRAVVVTYVAAASAAQQAGIFPTRRGLGLLLIFLDRGSRLGLDTAL
jgi:hypothetical protein